MWAFYVLTYSEYPAIIRIMKAKFKWFLCNIVPPMLVISFIIGVIVFFMCVTMSELKRVEQKNKSFKYRLTIHSNTYYADSYSYTNDVLTFVDGWTSNPMTFFREQIAIRQQK